MSVCVCMCALFVFYHSCAFRSCILTFDSLGSEHDRVIINLREYLTSEYEVQMKKKRTFDKNNMPGQSVRSPRQPNYEDCGLFVLQNIEQFHMVNFSCFCFFFTHCCCCCSETIQLCKWIDHLIADSN